MKNASFANKTKAKIEALPDVSETVRGQVNIDLAKNCLRANLSPGSLSKIVGVTRASVHGWLNGKRISRPQAMKVLVVLGYLKSELSAGNLPKTTKQDKQIVEDHLTEFVKQFVSSEMTLSERVSKLNLNNPAMERWLLGKD